MLIKYAELGLLEKMLYLNNFAITTLTKVTLQLKEISKNRDNLSKIKIVFYLLFT